VYTFASYLDSIKDILSATTLRCLNKKKIKKNLLQKKKKKKKKDILEA
jgi:hypothetical protein